MPQNASRTTCRQAPVRRAGASIIAATTFSASCAGCHKVSGEGGESGPDLSHVGARRDAATIKRIVRDPTSEFPDTMMPPFGERLSEQQINALVQYLAKRR